MMDILISWFAAAVFVLATAQTLRHGKFHFFCGPTIERAKQPLHYWTLAALVCAATVLVILAAIHYTIHP